MEIKVEQYGGSKEKGPNSVIVKMFNDDGELLGYVSTTFLPTLPGDDNYRVELTKCRQNEMSPLQIRADL